MRCSPGAPPGEVGNLYGVKGSIPKLVSAPYRRSSPQSTSRGDVSAGSADRGAGRCWSDPAWRRSGLTTPDPRASVGASVEGSAEDARASEERCRVPVDALFTDEFALHLANAVEPVKSFETVVAFY